MGSLLASFAPLLVLMFLPIGIPLIAMGIGVLTDRFVPKQHSPAESVVQAAWDRSAAWRAERDREIEELEKKKSGQIA